MRRSGCDASIPHSPWPWGILPTYALFCSLVSSQDTLFRRVLRRIHCGDACFILVPTPGSLFNRGENQCRFLVTHQPATGWSNDYFERSFKVRLWPVFPLLRLGALTLLGWWLHEYVFEISDLSCCFFRLGSRYPRYLKALDLFGTCIMSSTPPTSLPIFPYVTLFCGRFLHFPRWIMIFREHMLPRVSNL
jgi:hypothetical protein